jgi:hypothetical protein
VQVGRENEGNLHNPVDHHHGLWLDLEKEEKSCIMKSKLLQVRIKETLYQNVLKN